jgi:long-chain acyl-CoA synthetase
VVLRTSGSSGESRRVVRSTESWVASFDPVAELTALGAGSRVWVPGHLTATMNLFAAVHAAWLGAERVDEPGRATHATLTPSALAVCLDRGAPLAGAHVVVAGDGLAARLHRRAAAAGVTVHHYYGAAELSFVAWGGHAGDLRPFPGVTVEVRDGEIWARSPYLCDGYEGSPGALRRDASGFATVGDRGELSDGWLTVRGRPDAVNVGGATVLTADVEGVLRPEATGDLAVVAVPHSHLGSVVAVALTRPDDLVPVRRRARSRLEGAHRPRAWFHVPELPLTTAGKVDRAALAELLSADDGRATRLV